MILLPSGLVHLEQHCSHKYWPGRVGIAERCFTLIGVVLGLTLTPGFNSFLVLRGGRGGRCLCYTLLIMTGREEQDSNFLLAFSSAFTHNILPTSLILVLPVRHVDSYSTWCVSGERSLECLGCHICQVPLKLFLVLIYDCPCVSVIPS